ncbi:hypothetical protein V6N13_081162 [Hibiscus sabdariffa]
MVNVRKEWESRVLLAIEMARLEKESRLAKEAAILLMVAHDEFRMASFVCTIKICKASFHVDCLTSICTGNSFLRWEIVSMLNIKSHKIKYKDRLGTKRLHEEDGAD